MGTMMRYTDADLDGLLGASNHVLAIVRKTP